MDTIDKCRLQRGLIPILMLLMIVWTGGLTAQAQSENTLYVNVGEAVSLAVDSVTKLAIANPTIADVIPLSDKEVSIIGKKMGVTTLTVVRSDNKSTQVYRIEVGYDLIADLVHKVVGSSTVTVRTVGDTIVFDGYVNDEVQAQRVAQLVTALMASPTIRPQQVLNLIEVRKPHQVRIRTRVAEVNSDAIKNIGLQWFGPNGQVQYAMNFMGGGSIVNGFIPTASEFGTEGTTIVPNTVTMTVLLDLLISKDYARLLDEPTLTTLSGKEASFLVGEEIPIVQQLPQSFTVEFKDVGVRMKIKPTVDSMNQINTTVHAEVSQVTGTGSLGLPIIGIKETDTALQLKDGQTIVIGGLLENNISKDFARKLPWLGDIPGIGLLFRDHQFQKTQREVLFFMTTELVKDGDMYDSNPSQTPTMEKWLKTWNVKVLKVPKKGADWSLADPGNAGFGSSDQSDKKAEKAEKKAKPATVPAPAPVSGAPAAVPPTDPNANFAPARPAGN